jgi:NADH-quinone oxidoreductase subunit H
LFFLAEYLNMILMSSLLTIFFCGGWLLPLPLNIFSFVPEICWFVFKTCLFMFIFIWVRAAFPRLRYDQLMFLGWKVFLPLSLGYLIFIACILISF